MQAWQVCECVSVCVKRGQDDEAISWRRSISIRTRPPTRNPIIDSRDDGRVDLEEEKRRKEERKNARYKMDECCTDNPSNKLAGWQARRLGRANSRLEGSDDANKRLPLALAHEREW